MTAQTEPGKRIAAIIEPLMTAGIAKLEAAKQAGCNISLYLFCKPATSTQDAVLCMWAPDEKPEPGYILASAQPWPYNGPATLFRIWVYSRIGRLPMLSWNPN